LGLLQIQLHLEEFISIITGNVDYRIPAKVNRVASIASRVPFLLPQVTWMPVPVPESDIHQVRYMLHGLRKSHIAARRSPCNILS
jgi:hypothetical protein